MVGFLKPEGTFPHLSIHVQDDLRYVDEDGETYEPEEFEVSGTLNAGYEIIDPEYLDQGYEDFYNIDEIGSMLNFDDTSDYPFLDDYLKHEALNETDASVETQETLESPIICGQRVGGERHLYLPTLDAERKYFRAMRNAGGHGTEPKWQKHAGGGKRGRQSIRLTVPAELLAATDQKEAFEALEAELWFREWIKEQEAQAYIQEVLMEFVDFGDEPLKLAA